MNAVRAFRLRSAFTRNEWAMRKARSERLQTIGQRSGNDAAGPYRLRRPGLQAALLAVLVLAATITVAKNSFVSLDDLQYVGNPLVMQGVSLRGIAFAFTSVTALYWHPLAWLSHELDFELFAANPGAHHLASVLLHAISSAFLFLFLRRLGAGARSAIAGALLWAVHPLRVESFAWVAERKDVLCAFFFTAALLAYAPYAERPSGGRYAAWLGLGVLALMSKPTAVCLAPILLILDYWPLHRTSGLVRLLVEKLPLFGTSAVVMFLTIYGQARSGSMSHLADVAFATRLANAPISYARYIGKILWPVGLSCFYAYDRHPGAAWVISSTLLLGAISAVAIRQRRRRPWLLAGWLWFVVALLPNIGLLQAGRQSIADRFTHLGMIGIAIAVTWTLTDWAGARSSRRKQAMWVACGVLAALTALTIRQIGFWRDSSTLFEHAISVEDGDYMRAALATSLIMQQRYAEAELHLRVAIRQAPGRFELHNNIANVLLKTGRTEQAAEEAAIALRLAPNDISVAETTGLISFQQGDGRGALLQFDRAVGLGADPLPVATEFNDMGASLASHGKPEEAEPLIRRAAELNPAMVQAHRNLVLVLEDQGRPDEARAALQQAIRATGPHHEYADLAQELRVGAPPAVPPTGKQ
jgi:Flp pilus assembly protein TadD